MFLVEDEGVIAIDLRECLTALGYEVCGMAGRGDAALQMIAEEHPDLVLMDIKLAGPVDGADLARQLRDTQNVPVVFLSAFVDPGLIARAAESGCYGYLVKPFDVRELHATIQIALARFRALR